MPRYIRARRTRSIATDTELNQLRDQFIRQLTRDAQLAMRDLSQQFNQDLERQSGDLLSSLLGNGENGSASSNSLMGIFSSASRYMTSRIRTTESASETIRSREETERFRVSQAQLLAETNALISRGDKNS